MACVTAAPIVLLQKHARLSSSVMGSILLVPARVVNELPVQLWGSNFLRECGRRRLPSILDAHIRQDVIARLRCGGALRGRRHREKGARFKVVWAWSDEEHGSASQVALEPKWLRPGTDT